MSGAISETELLAYVDGELDAADRARVEAAIENDDLLARRVATQRGLRARLNASYNSVLDEAIPSRLLDVLKRDAPADATVTNIASARAERAAATRTQTQAAQARVTRSAWSWREWSAVAASITLGVLLGPAVLNHSQSLPLLSENGRVVAVGELDQALMWQTAREPNPDVVAQMGVSFRTTDGRFCRSFALRQGPSGLACRERSDWVVEVLARGPARADDPKALRQAASNLPEVLRQAIDARIEGDAFDENAEWAAIQKRWRK